MPLEAGRRLGLFEVISPLGAGGMGEVYRARDTRLGRDVALKVLPETLANRPDRRSRFEREARALAALSHPGIASIHGVEESEGVTFLVLELVEGHTLAERLRRGPLPVREALELARQIAEALAAAHERGVVHRDLKPSNVMIGAAGRVKLLDFGLAKDLGEEGSDDSSLPTATATGEGVILGTAPYMSPEQVRGEAVDKRTDIWAFGCVLFEMLTGRRAFPGPTTSEAIAAVLGREPEWNALPAATPSLARSVLRHCLARDPARRLHDIADARLEIDEALQEHPGSEHVSPSELSTARSARERAAWIAAGACLLALVSVLARMSRETPGAEAPTFRASIVFPEGVRFSQTLSPAGRFALSPDGRRLAFVADDGTGRTMLWIRHLDTAIVQAVAGTEDAAFPFWSPDSRFVAFRAQGKLKKIDASGGPTFTLCDATSDGTGAWNRNDVILFTPQGNSPLYRVPAVGGTPAPATKLDEPSGEAQHWFPYFLPDGRHFLYFALGSKTGGAIAPRAVRVGSLDPKEPSKLVLEGGSNAKYAGGHLLFLRGRTLMAQPFDVGRLELRGQAVPLAERVQTPGAGDTGTAGAFSVADTGVLVYQTGLDVVRSQLVWFDRGGQQVALVGDQADYAEVSLSADGRRAAVSVLEPARGTRDLWLYDVPRGLRTRFTSEPEDEMSPVWSPDGSRVMFASGRKGGIDIYEKALSGPTSDNPLLEADLGEFPTSVSPDGRFLLYVFGSGTMRRSDLWVLSLVGEKKAFPFVQTPFIETQGQFSPDGQWIAYASNESGQFEVYVAQFPGPGSRSRVSSTGGSWPRWRRDGKELFFLAPGSILMSASVASQGSDFVVGAVRPLFVVRPRPRVRLDAYTYDVAPDGQRFIVNSFVEETSSAAITLMINWTAGLR